MSVALDFGSSEFRTLRRQDNRLIARRIPAVYTALENWGTVFPILEVDVREREDVSLLINALVSTLEFA